MRADTHTHTQILEKYNKTYYFGIPLQKPKWSKSCDNAKIHSVRPHIELISREANTGLFSKGGPGLTWNDVTAGKELNTHIPRQGGTAVLEAKKKRVRREADR